MITVTVHKFGNFPISTKKIKDAVKKTLEAEGMVSDTEASVAIVTKKKMEEYVNEYYGADGTDHPVLSFPVTETKGRFVTPPDGVIHLGEIIISYSWAVEEAKKKNRLVDDIMIELAQHGTLHLIGKHHD